MRRLSIVFASIIILSLSIWAHAGVTTRVSVSSNGTQPGDDCVSPCISGDGRHVAFFTIADELVPGDTNMCTDVFVHDRQTGETERVSVAGDGTQANDYSMDPSISADGRCVAFYSRATNLVSGDTNSRGDVFVHDRQTGQTTRVSVASDSTQGNALSLYPSISADGRFVAFASHANNLVSGDTNGGGDIFVHDRQTAQTTRVSVATGGVQGAGDDRCERPAISADGLYVAFNSYASDLVPGDTNGTYDIFVHDRQTVQTLRVSVAGDGTQADGRSDGASISGDGRFVAFISTASNLVLGDTNGYEDAFVHDLQTGETERVSIASGGAQADGVSFDVSISAGGRCVAFASGASNLVPGHTNGMCDIFVHDRDTGKTVLLSVSSDAQQAGGGSGDTSISADGRYVAFLSDATNLVPGDTNGDTDVFVRDRYSVGDTKLLQDGADAVASGNAVTAYLSGCFYVEEADRSSGVKVSWAGAVVEGDRYRVDGVLDTDANGERYIDAWNVRAIDTSPVSPLGLRNEYIGGHEKDYNPQTGAGQKGIQGASGLSNIGLLITTWGRVTQIGAEYLYIDDGSALEDGTYTGMERNIGVRVICDPADYDVGDYLIVTGISSCFETPSGDIARRILTRRPEDVRKVAP